MRRNRKNSIKKERIIMITSSAFVLAALTMTGMYMKGQEVESKDDGYTLDFTTLENNADEKFDEIAQNQGVEELAQNDMVSDSPIIEPEVEGELDYMPLEVGSGDIEIPGLTDKETLLKAEEIVEAEVEPLEDTEILQEELEDIADEEVSATDIVVEQELHFSEDMGLLRPVSGETLLPYSMDSSIYFATLDQYKYNPAVMLSAEEGTQVRACAQGKIVNVYQDNQIGNAVVIDLGNGYQATYGQLKDIGVPVNSYVNEGDVIGLVAAPTKYYSVEGSNLYFKLTLDGVPVNPEILFR